MAAKADAIEDIDGTSFGIISGDARIRVSIAVSLKRIADSLSFLDQIAQDTRTVRVLLEEDIAYKRARS